MGLFFGVNDRAMVRSPIAPIHSRVVADDRDGPESESPEHAFKAREIGQPVRGAARLLAAAVDH